VSKWHPIERLVDYATRLLTRQGRAAGHYSKRDLVAASKQVFDGFGAAIRPVRTQAEIEHCRNSLALIDGHYPLSTSGCEVVGLSGGCGPTCPVLIRGECDEEMPEDEAAREEKHQNG
jgi:hypothetical protein